MEAVIMWIARIVLGIIAAIITHEAGHCIAAIIFGKSPSLVLKLLKIKSVTIYQPCIVVKGEMSDKARRAFGVGGFAFEFFAVWALMLAADRIDPSLHELAIFQMLISILHLTSYPFYNAGNDVNDFRHLQ